MYIMYNNTNYPCKCKIGVDIRYIGLPEDFPSPVSGTIQMYADDGFLMRTDTAEDYLRQTFEGGVLTLTNTPEPEPVESEEVPEPDEGDDPVTWNDLAQAYNEGVNSLDE